MAPIVAVIICGAALTAGTLHLRSRRNQGTGTVAEASQVRPPGREAFPDYLERVDKTGPTDWEPTPTDPSDPDWTPATAQQPPDDGATIFYPPDDYVPRAGHLRDREWVRLPPDDLPPLKPIPNDGLPSGGNTPDGSESNDTNPQTREGTTAHTSTPTDWGPTPTDPSDPDWTPATAQQPPDDGATIFYPPDDYVPRAGYLRDREWVRLPPDDLPPLKPIPNPGMVAQPPPEGSAERLDNRFHGE